MKPISLAQVLLENIGCAMCQGKLEETVLSPKSWSFSFLTKKWVSPLWQELVIKKARSSREMGGGHWPSKEASIARFDYGGFRQIW